MSTFVLFVALPAIQVLAAEPEPDTLLLPVDDIELPPPPPPPEEPEEEPEPEPEEAPPELEQELPQLELDQLSLLMGGEGGADAFGFGAFVLDLGGAIQKDDTDALFSGADLDQEARPIDQAMPSLNAKLRRRTPASVVVLLVVDERGRVDEARVQRSSDPAFDRAALSAVRRWKFEPGRRGGAAVRSRLRVPITFKDQDQ